MEKNISKTPSDPQKTKENPNKGSEKARWLSEKTKQRICRVLGIVGVGGLGAVGMAALGVNPFFAGAVGGILASKYQEKTKK